jgi:cell wall-associated NlpC family hydrolase
MRIDGREFLARALTHQGKSYVWDAKGPEQFDCSGLVTYVIRECGGPELRSTHNTTKLYTMLEPWLLELERAFLRGIPTEVLSALDILPGTLVFYGEPGGVDHVMIATGDGRVFGATGGGRSTTTPKPGACVQFRATVGYRPGVRGFRKLPEVMQ